MPALDPPGWGVVVPVKPLALAKSRLGAYGDALRCELALAFAEDVVAVLVRCPQVRHVLVVSDDARAARALAAHGAQVVPDAPAAGLNAALSHGADVLRAVLGPCGVAAVPADLPGLRAAHLTAALTAARPARRAFVPDADGRGTTLLAACAGVGLAPGYGPGSRERHRAAGAVELAAADGLRRDVDTPQDLVRALALGVGPRTAAVAARAGAG